MSDFVTKQELAKFIDSTALSPTLGSREVETLCREAESLGFYAVCVPPCWVAHAKSLLKSGRVKIATVVSFPHGNDTSSSKAGSAVALVTAGADEIDMVMNLAWAKEGNWSAVEQEICSVVQAAKVPVKVILETCLLTDPEIIGACGAAARAGAKFVKTSTGFAKSGATVEAVRLMKASIPPTMEVKASGGIRDEATALVMIEAGATRLGTSSGAAILAGKEASATY